MSNVSSCIFSDTKNIAVNAIKCEKISFIVEECIQKMHTEWQIVQALMIRLQSDLGLNCLTGLSVQRLNNGNIYILCNISNDVRFLGLVSLFLTMLIITWIFLMCIAVL